VPEHSFEIASYDVDLDLSPEGATSSLRLEGEDGDDPQSIAYLNFYPEARLEPRRRIGIASSVVSVTADVHRSEYERFYHLLQTEKPVYCYAQYESGDEPIRDVESFGVSTDLETVGEGFEDWSF
jgi:hypothetical protein